ncbi:MAG: FAD-binding oxidoreductase [Methylobacteriaceae bacterium]|jgi:sarcosine oxidase subunit beta|nr:FAD-binding oxidoreductase [Methylobacteriaceae bacterium]
MSTSVSADLIVIGGGIHGCSAALHAAMRGMSVVVLEKDTVGRHASGANAGGVRRLRRLLPEVPISVRSAEIWLKISDFLDDDCGFRIAPQIEVAENEQDMEKLQKRHAEITAQGFQHEVLLDRDAMREVIPAVADYCLGALATMDDGYAQPYQTTFAFERKARRAGVKILEHTAVTGVHRDGKRWQVDTAETRFTGSAVLNAAGAWGGRIAAWLREPVPLKPFAPMMIVTDRLPHFCDAVVILANRPLSFKQMPNGTVVIGGGRPGYPDLDTNGSVVRVRQLCLSAATAIDAFPHMRSATVIRTWAGLDGIFADGLPVIGRSSTEENIYHAFGFCGHGFQMGPAVGELMGELIAAGTCKYSLEPFAVTRFKNGAAGSAPGHG